MVLSWYIWGGALESVLLTHSWVVSDLHLLSAYCAVLGKLTFYYGNLKTLSVLSS